ncbi:MAG: cation diffusion facilitator family transporter [Lachnospiraceae bacterium]|nr:cation diffusion facilitator family transporter [Lachnospiraceae bacterium]
MILERIFLHRYIGKKVTAQIREKYGVFASVVGVVCNVFLSVSKIILGALVGSVAIVADGFNNLSDASSAVVSLVGIKLSSKPADKEHPFGHGRYEYIAALVVAFLILEVAITCFKDGARRIFEGGELQFSWISVILLAASMLLKLWLSFFYRRIGKKVDSQVCMATSKDAMGDVFITGAALVSMIVFKLFDLDIDGWVGCGVSIMIFIAGIDVAKDTIEPLIGEAIPRELYNLITGKVESYEGVVGSHDLLVHSYGHNKRMASIHVEFNESLGMNKIHETVERIEEDILRELEICLVIHADPVNPNDEEAAVLRKDMTKLLKEFEPEATIHDFRIMRNEERTLLVFDVVVPYSVSDLAKRELALELENTIKKQNRKIDCRITVENSFISD